MRIRETHVAYLLRCFLTIDKVCVSVFILGPNDIRVQPTNKVVRRLRPRSRIIYRFQSSTADQILCAWFRELSHHRLVPAKEPQGVGITKFVILPFPDFEKAQIASKINIPLTMSKQGLPDRHLPSLVNDLTTCLRSLRNTKRI